MLCEAACVCCWLEQSRGACMLLVQGVPARGMPGPGYCIADVAGRARLLDSSKILRHLCLGLYCHQQQPSLWLRPLTAAQESRRKAQHELAEARSSEQATQQRSTALTKEVANLKSQVSYLNLPAR